MRVNKAPMMTTATSMYGKTDAMMIIVNVTRRQYCRKESMTRGSIVSTSS